MSLIVSTKYKSTNIQNCKKLLEQMKLKNTTKIPTDKNIILRKRFLKQARKSSEDAQAAGYAQFEKVWAG